MNGIYRQTKMRAIQLIQESSEPISDREALLAAIRERFHFTEEEAKNYIVDGVAGGMTTLLRKQMGDASTWKPSALGIDLPTMVFTTDERYVPTGDATIDQVDAFVSTVARRDAARAFRSASTKRSVATVRALGIEAKLDPEATLWSDAEVKLADVARPALREAKRHGIAGQ